MSGSDMNIQTPSQEFSVDVAMETIVAKVAAGTASPEETAQLGHLTARRVRLMRRSGGSSGRRRVAA